LTGLTPTCQASNLREKCQVPFAHCTGKAPCSLWWTRSIRKLSALWLLVFLASCAPISRLGEQTEGEAAALAVRYAEENHYSNINVDNRISLATLENYLNTLDGEQLYFTSEDEEQFRSRHGHHLGQAMRQQQLDAVFEIYHLYKRRRAEFLDSAQDYLSSHPSISSSGEWILDRSHVPRPADTVELKALWRDRVRHELINLMLDNRNYEAASAILRHRYNLQRNKEQLESESPVPLFIDSFARALDSRSSYSSLNSFQLSNNEPLRALGGVGVLLGVDNDRIVVRKVLPGSPAASGRGPLAGDQIIGIDPYGNGTIVDITGWSLGDANELMYGRAGTPIAVRFLRRDGGIEPFKVRMQRVSTLEYLQGAKKNTEEGESHEVSAEVVVQDPTQMRLGQRIHGVKRGAETLSIGTISLREFYRNCARDVEQLIDQLKAKGVDGLVVDLRNNPGGKGDEALLLAGMFVGKGPIFQWRDQKRRVRVLHNRKQPVIWNGPLAVLVNQRSASGSEIFAAAIQDYGRGVVVGQRTLGKGTMNSNYAIRVKSRGDSRNATLTITTHKSYRITGDGIQSHGVEPDILLPAVDGNWPLGRMLTRVFGSSIADRTSERNLPWDEIPAISFRRSAMSPLPLTLLLAEHQQRALTNVDWQLMEGQIELSRQFKQRQREPLDLDQRLEIEAAWLAQELTRAKKWLAASGSSKIEVEQALAETLLQWKTLLLPNKLALAVEDPAVARALMLARGYAFVPTAKRAELKIYDLPLEQTVMIVSDLVRLHKNPAAASVPPMS